MYVLMKGIVELVINYDVSPYFAAQIDHWHRLHRIT